MTLNVSFGTIDNLSLSEVMVGRPIRPTAFKVAKTQGSLNLISSAMPHFVQSKRPSRGCRGSTIPSRSIDFGRVDQHNRDVILNRIQAFALPAFQAFTIRGREHRLLALRTNEQIQQILRNHRHILS